MFFLKTVKPHRNRKLKIRKTVLFEGKNRKTAHCFVKEFHCPSIVPYRLGDSVVLFT